MHPDDRSWVEEIARKVAQEEIKKAIKEWLEGAKVTQVPVQAKAESDIITVAFKGE